MHVHIVSLIVIGVLALLASFVNRKLVPSGTVQNVVYVCIVVIAVLFTLMSLGIMGNPGINVSTN